MSTVSVSDGGGLTKLFDVDGDGSTTTPFVPIHKDRQLETLFGTVSLVGADGALKVKVIAEPGGNSGGGTGGNSGGNSGGTTSAAPVPALTYCPELGTVAGGIIKAGATQLLAIGVTNICPEPRYLMLFNQSGYASEGSTATRSYLVMPGQFLALTDLFTAGQTPGLGLKFTIGLVWAWSTTPIELTIGAEDELLFEARYI